MALYEELLKKEGEVTALKAKALQLMRHHEEAVGCDGVTQQLQQLGKLSAWKSVKWALGTR